MNESVEPNNEISTDIPVPAQPVAPVLEQAPLVIATEPLEQVAVVSVLVTEAPVEVADTSVAVAVAVVDGAPRVGRYTHAELAAMQGKRGRKPPEFYELYPKSDAGDAPVAAKPSKPGRPAKATSAAVGRPRVPAVRISSAMIGDHSIDELLEMVGVTGKKPVAFDILRQAAQLFADRGALDLPKSTHDPLAQQVAAAPAKVRELIAELVRLGKR